MHTLARRRHIFPVQFSLSCLSVQREKKESRRKNLQARPASICFVQFPVERKRSASALRSAALLACTMRPKYAQNKINHRKGNVLFGHLSACYANSYHQTTYSTHILSNSTRKLPLSHSTAAVPFLWHARADTQFGIYRLQTENMARKNMRTHG